MSIELQTYSLSAIALEAKANPFNMLSPLVKQNLLKHISTTSSTLAALVKNFNITKYKPTKLSFKPYIVTQAITNEQYVDLANINIPVPAGFTGSYLDYTKFLQHTYNELYDIVDTTLKPVAKALSLIVSHPRKVTGSTTIDTLYNSINYPKQALDTFKTDMKQFYVKDSLVDTQPYSVLFTRNKDVEAFFNEVAKLNKLYAKNPTDRIINQTNYISEVSDLLYTRLANGKLPQLQQNSAQLIAQILSDASEVVAAYAALVTLIEQLISYSGEVYNHFVNVLKV